MPTQKALNRYKELGSLAEQVQQDTQDIEHTMSSGDRTLQAQALKTLADRCSDIAFQALVHKLTYEQYAYNRELAAIIIKQLWLYWKFMPYDEPHEQSAKVIDAYTGSLRWTLPYLEKLLQDKRSGPCELAIFVFSDLEDVPADANARLRKYAGLAFTNSFADVRLAAVQNTYYLYLFGTDGYDLDEPALKRYVAATYDTDERVRDWACFSLWNDIESTGKTVEQAFIDAANREPFDSDVYMEAVIGLAQLDYESIIPIILTTLDRDDWGGGWLDAVTASHDTDCLLRAMDLYQELSRTDPTDRRVAQLELLFETWND